MKKITNIAIGYAETLVLYQSVFESPPPIDIWPPPKTIEPPVEEPVPVIRNAVKLLIVILLLFPFSYIYYRYNIAFPFSLKGPQFLVFLPVLSLCSILCYILIQHEKVKHFPVLAHNWFPQEATAFETAQFLYGRKRFMHAAIVDLIRRNLLVLTTDKMFMLYPHRYIKPENEQNPLIPSFLKEGRDCVTYQSIMDNWGKEVPEELTHLQRLYEMANRKESYFKRNNFLIIPVVIGVARFCQGVANHKPVSFLFLEMIALFIATSMIAKAFARTVLNV